MALVLMQTLLLVEGGQSTAVLLCHCCSVLHLMGPERVYIRLMHAQVGRQEPVMVLRVDKEKGYIDLSKRRVAAEDIAACEERYNKSKMVHSIMRHVAETTGQELEGLYDSIAWPLYKAYGHAFEAFKVRDALAIHWPISLLYLIATCIRQTHFNQARMSCMH